MADKEFIIDVKVLSDKALAKLRDLREKLTNSAGKNPGQDLARMNPPLEKASGLLQRVIARTRELANALNRVGQSGAQAGNALAGGMSKAERSALAAERAARQANHRAVSRTLMGTQMAAGLALNALGSIDTSKQTTGQAALTGAGRGALQGAMIGSMLGPLGTLGGALAGGAIGAVSARFGKMTEETKKAEEAVKAFNEAANQSAYQTRTLIRSIRELGSSDEASRMLEQLAEETARVRDQMALGIVKTDVGEMQLTNLARAAREARSALDDLNQAELDSFRDELKASREERERDAQMDARFWLVDFDVSRADRQERQSFEDGLIGKSNPQKLAAITERVARLREQAAMLRDEMESDAVMSMADVFSQYAEKLTEVTNQIEGLERNASRLSGGKTGASAKLSDMGDRLSRVGGFVGGAGISPLMTTERLLAEGNNLAREQVSLLGRRGTFGSSTFATG